VIQSHCPFVVHHGDRRHIDTSMNSVDEKIQGSMKRAQATMGVELEGEGKTVDHNVVLVCRVPVLTRRPRSATPGCTHVASMSALPHLW
jgi:hypothetical protein